MKRVFLTACCLGVKGAFVGLEMLERKEGPYQSPFVPLLL